MIRLAPLALLLAGCAALSSRPAAPAPPALRLTVRSLPATNEGRPLRLLLREVDERTFLSASYEAVAAQVVEADAMVVATEIIYPGHDREIVIRREIRHPLGLYFLFTAPSREGQGEWRHLLQPPLRRAYAISLRENRIAEVVEK